MNCLLELLFSAIVYLIQILSFVGIVFCLNRIISLINAKYSKARFIAIAIILFALIAKGTSDPIIICPNLYQNSFTQEKRIVAKDIARGLYSDRIPLFPLWAKIENIKRDGTATISVHYGFIPCVIVHSFCDEGPLGINQSGRKS